MERAPIPDWVHQNLLEEIRNKTKVKTTNKTIEGKDYRITGIKTKDIWIPTSLADLIDRIAILSVKLCHLEGEKLHTVKRQHATLTKILAGQERWSFTDLKELEEINNVLWCLEDGVRKNANLPDYRDVTYWNDERAKVKKRIDEKAGSELREVKSYV